jgi:AcrR family transcriptional regulator
MTAETQAVTDQNNNRQNRTRERIINLALRLLAKKPKASMNEIAEAVDLSRATLFRYFNSRKQLVHDLVVEVDRKLENATRPIFEKNLPARETLDQFVTVLVPLGASFNFLDSEHIEAEDSDIRDLYKNQLLRLKELSGKLRAEGVVSPDVPLAWTAAVLDNLIYTAWVTVSEGDIAANDAPGLVLKSFLRGLSPL